jgi:hypothetical protein
VVLEPTELEYSSYLTSPDGTMEGGYWEKFTYPLLKYHGCRFAFDETCCYKKKWFIKNIDLTF